MHNKDSANEFNMDLTGNARAFKYSDEPLIRMRNTAIAKGKDKLNDMITRYEEILGKNKKEAEKLELE